MNQNICGDFPFLCQWTADDVRALATLISALAVVAGVMVARRQLDSWRREKIVLRKSELAEDILVACHEIRDQLSTTRSPIGYGPPNGEDDDGTYDYIRRIKEIEDLSDKFDLIRRLALREKALIGSDSIDQDLKKFFDARFLLLRHLQSKIREIRREKRNKNYIQTHKERDRSEKDDEIIWAGYAEGDDPIWSILDPAILSLESILIPMIRLEE